MGLAGGRVAWVVLCHGDCWWACRVGGAGPLGLLVGVSRGRRRVHFQRPGLYRIAILGVWCGSGLSRVQTVHVVKAGLVENRHFWVLGRVRALAGQNVSF